MLGGDPERAGIEHQIAVRLHVNDEALVVAVRERYLARGEEEKLPPEFTADLFELLIAATCKEEDDLMAALETSSEGGDA